MDRARKLLLTGALEHVVLQAELTTNGGHDGVRVAAVAVPQVIDRPLPTPAQRGTPSATDATAATIARTTRVFRESLEWCGVYDKQLRR